MLRSLLSRSLSPHFVAIVTFLLGLLAPRGVRAQGNAYSAPIGGRSALMGNTGIALGIDGAAPFLNPATIVRLNDQRFSFSVNFYNYSLTHFSNWHDPGQIDTTKFGNVSLGNTGLTSTGFGGLPSTLCLFFTLAPGSPDPSPDLANLDSWRQKLAICLGTSEAQSVAFSALPFNAPTSIGQTAQAASLVQSWNRLNIGPSYSVAISRRLALGLSLHGVYTTESYLLDNSSITSSVMNGGVQSSVGISGGGNSFDFSSILGAIYSAAPYTFGLSVTLPAVHAFGSYSGSMHNETSSGTMSMATLSNGTGSFTSAPPIRVAVGAGVQWPRVSLEVDESLNIPAPSGFSAAVTGTTTTLSGTSLTSTPFATAFSVREHPVLNTALGGEFFVRPDFSLVSGFSFNLSALPGLAPTMSVGNIVQQRENLITASAGVGTYSRGGSNLLLGFQFGYGWGDSIAANPYVAPNQLGVIDTQSYSVLFILAGSTSLRSLGHAVVRIENVISGDKPTPESKPDKTNPPEKTPPPAKTTSPEKPPLTSSPLPPPVPFESPAPAK